MVQLPSAARLSGNSRPAASAASCSDLQDAAGFHRHREVVARRWRARAFMRCRLSTTCAPDCVGHAADHQAGVAALRHDGHAGGGAGLHHGRHFRGAAGPHHGQRLAARALAPVLFPGAQVAFGAAHWRRRRRRAVRSIRSFMCSPWPQAQCARAARRPRTAAGTARSPARQPAAARPVAPGAHHAFGEIEPHQQADPAVGVHAVLQQAGQRDAQRQHLQRPAVPPGRSGASHSSQARPSTIRPSDAADGEPAVVRIRRAGAVAAEEVGSMGDGIIAADEPAPTARRPHALPVAVHGADAGRALPRRPAGPDGQQPHLHHHHRAGAASSRWRWRVFTAFPMFGKLQGALQAWLVQSLVPDAIAAPGAGLPHAVRRQGQPPRRGRAWRRCSSPRSRWCSPSTARSTASGACSGRGRWRSAC